MSLKKKEIHFKRLKSKTAIEHLFVEGKVLRSKHLIFRVIDKHEGDAFYAGVSVAKRNHKKAVDRNRIKRQLRIALTAHKTVFSFPGYGMLLFKGKKKLTTATILAEANNLFAQLENLRDK